MSRVIDAVPFRNRSSRIESNAVVADSDLQHVTITSRGNNQHTCIRIARNPMPSPNEGRIVRGKEARFARLTEGLVELPKQPKSASFFTVLGQESKQAAE